MAKAKNSKKQHETGLRITTPSPYGSHKSMVVDPGKVDGFRELLIDEVLCQDDTHYYITKKNRLDSGLADPNRYCGQKSTQTEVENDISE